MNDEHPGEFDKRIYVRIDHDMPENPKVVGLSDGAFRAYFEAICYCSRQKSNGRIPVGRGLSRLGPPEVLEEVAEAGLFIRGDRYWQIHDYLKHQRSAAEIEILRSSKSAAGTAGAHIRWHVGKRAYDAKCVHCNPSASIAEGDQ